MNAIVFDLDGTLVDSAPDIHACANQLLAEMGFGALELDQVRSFIGHGIGNLVQRCLEASGTPRTGEDLAHCIMRFGDMYADAPAACGNLYPGVVETLSHLKGQGWILGICTNKADRFTDLVLEGYDLSNYFTAVVSGNSSTAKKPSPDPLIECARRLESSAEQIVYVGDSETDAETARRASVPFALFTKGYRSMEPDQIPHDVKFSSWLDAVPVILSMTD